MKKIFALILLGILGVFISACSSTPELLVTPVPDKLTFLFFYTEG